MKRIHVPCVRASRCILLLLAASFTLAATGETRYIRDQLFVPLRGGQSTEHRIVHRGIPSGTPLELLETNEESGYSLVRMADGLEGWIQTQYLSEEPVARDQLRDLRQRYANLAEEMDATRRQLTESEARIGKLNQEKAQLEEHGEEVSAELSRITRLATDVVEVDEENRALKEENLSLVAEIDNLSSINMELESRKEREWYWLGAGTVIISVLLGIWIGRKIYFGRTFGGWS